MNTQNAIDKGKEAVERSGRELRAEIDDLTAQVEKLTGELGKLGRSGMRTARASAAQGLDALGRTRDDFAESVGRELAHVEERATVAIRERPVQTLGIAVAVGFLFAMFLRR